jgi:hypothetical protein
MLIFSSPGKEGKSIMEKSFLIKIIVFVVTITLWNATGAHSQDGDAGQAGEFLRHGVDARGLAMGRAYTAIADGASAIYWNPAGLMSLKEQNWWNAAMMLTKVYGGASYNYFGAAMSLDRMFNSSSGFLTNQLSKLKIGFAVTYLDMGGFEEINQYNKKTGETFSDNQCAFSFSIAYSTDLKGQKLGIGLNTKYISHKLFNEQGNDTGFDFGIKYTPSFGWINLAYVHRNFNTPNLKFGGGADDIIPSTSKLAISVEPQYLKIPALNGLLLAVEFDINTPTKKNRDVFVGLEFDWRWVRNYLPFKTRLGWSGDNQSFTMGINFDSAILWTNLLGKFSHYFPRIDWAMSTHSELNTLGEKFSFSFKKRTSDRELYEKGKESFVEPDECATNKTFKPTGKEYFKQAVDPEAVSGGNANYKVAAWLRLGDFEILKEESKPKGLVNALYYYEVANSIGGSERIDEVDTELNKISYLYYIQGLIYNEEFLKATHNCHTNIIWTNHTIDKNENSLKYLEACALQKNGDLDSAKRILSNLDSLDYSPATYMLGMLKRKNGGWQDAKNLFKKLTRQKPKKPSNIFYPEDFADCSVIDDCLFYLGECYEELGQKKDAEYAFVKIIINYPMSNRLIAAREKLMK